MKKPANLVDKALEVARKVRSVPKKPVKTKGKKTVPEALDWGPGIPLDKLAYLNDDEMALVQAKRMFKGKRDYRGVPAFPDPGDTAAGDSGQGTSSSGGLNDGGGSTYGGGGGSDSGAGGGGGMGSYGGGDSGVGGGTGGGSDSGSTGGVGGTTGGGSDSGGGTSSGAGSTTGGGSDSGAGGTSATSGTTSTETKSPSSGPTSQPVRSEPSSYAGPSAVSAPTPPSSYQSYGGYDPTASAPSTMASESTLDRIASGSSVIGNTPTLNYPSAPKIQDRIAPVSYAQAPTVPAGPVDTTGANSPFADPEVQSYYADTPTVPQAQTVSLSNLADPNLQQAADYSFAQNNRLSGLSGYGSLNTPQETAMAQPTASYSPTSAMTQPSNPEMAEIVAGDVPPRALGTLPQGYAQTGRVLNAAGMGYPTASLSDYSPAAQTSVVASAPPAAVGAAPVSAPAYTNTNVFYSSPAEQAADVRRAVALAQGPATQPTEINIPGGDIPAQMTPASIETAPPSYDAAGEYDYNPTKDPANYMRPIYPGDEDQPGYMTPEQRSAYLSSLGDTRSSERPPPGYYQPKPEVETEPVKKNKPKKDPIRKYKPYEYRDYMYTGYDPIRTKPDADIAAFNRYNQQNFNSGGKVNDSVQAAIRIAKSKLL